MNRQKKILIVTGIFPPDIGGPASFAKACADAFSPNHSVTVISYAPTWLASKTTLPYKRILIPRKLFWPLRHALYAFRVFFQTRKADTILALNAINAGPAALLASKFFRKKFFVRIAGDRAWETAIQNGSTVLLVDDFQKYPRYGWTGIVHRFQVWVCRRAAGIIVPSEYLAGIVRGWGIIPSKIKVIYNGVDTTRLEIAKENARRQIGIAGHIILSVGRLVPWKGFRMLIKIMPQLLTINQFFRLVVVGDGPDLQILKTMVKNLNLDRKVYLVGSKTKAELASYLAAADMFVLNSGYEGFSHQILEAMGSGVPTIASATGGNQEVVVQGENGLLVRYNDEFNLVQAIKALWEMPELQEQFSKAGMVTASKYKIKSTMDDLYRYLTS